MNRCILTLSILALSAAAFGMGGRGQGRGGPGMGDMGAMPGGFGGGFGPGGQNMGGFGGFTGMSGYGAPADPSADPATIQKSLAATNEEFTVIWTKLQKIQQLRAQVNASLANGNAPGTDMMGMMGLGAPGMPGGANSLEGSTQPGGIMGGGMPGMGGMPGRGGPGMGGMGGMPGMAGGMPGFAGQQGPFASPPSANNAAFGGMGGPAMGGMGMPGMGGPPGMGAMPGMFSTSQANAVQSLLSELQTLLSDNSTTEDQIRDKLALIRATRNKAKSDLAAAQADVTQLLTTKQIATLVNLGILD